MTNHIGELLGAYLATDYWILDAPTERPIRLRIDERCPDLQPFATACGGELRAAFITACNPRGNLASHAENVAADSGLAAELARLGATTFRGEGRGRVGNWPPEQSWLALPVSFEDACVLGRKFRQNAIVWIGPDLTPVLAVLRGA